MLVIVLFVALVLFLPVAIIIGLLQEKYPDGQQKESNLEFEQSLRIEFYDKITKVLDDKRTKPFTAVTFYYNRDRLLDGFTFYDSITNHAKPNANKVNRFRISVKNTSRACDTFFKKLYDVVRTYSWIKHYPDRPISESNTVQLSEEETAAAHKFFMDNLTDYMYTRYWLEEFDRDGMEIHHVISPNVYATPLKKDPYFGLADRIWCYADEGVVPFKDYCVSGEYTDEQVLEYPEVLHYIHVNDKGYEYDDVSKAKYFNKSFFPIMPSLKLFAECPVFPPSPPEDLFWKKKTILQTIEDYTAIIRDHYGAFAESIKLVKPKSKPINYKKYRFVVKKASLKLCPMWMNTEPREFATNCIVKTSKDIAEVELKSQGWSLSPNGVNNFGWQENNECGYYKKTEKEWDAQPIRQCVRADWLSFAKHYPPYHEKTKKITLKEVDMLLEKYCENGMRSYANSYRWENKGGIQYTYE